MRMRQQCDVTASAWELRSQSLNENQWNGVSSVVLEVTGPLSPTVGFLCNRFRHTDSHLWEYMPRKSRLMLRLDSPWAFCARGAKCRCAALAPLHSTIAHYYCCAAPPHSTTAFADTQAGCRTSLQWPAVYIFCSCCRQWPLLLNWWGTVSNCLCCFRSPWLPRP